MPLYVPLCTAMPLQGRPDVAKGSYYANPLMDRPFESEACIQKYPAFAHPNIWPDEVPAMRPALMSLGQLIVQVLVPI